MNPLDRFPWLVRLAAGLGAAVMLAALAGRADRFGAALMYAASWVLLLHIMVGEYVLVRHLHANTHAQRVLDAMAFVLFLGGTAVFTTPRLWCAFMAGVFALAIIKYVLVEQAATQPALRQYALEKIRWEAPSVFLFAGLAVYMDVRAPREGAALPLVELALLSAAVFFAVWMIVVRHIYRRVARAARENKSHL